MDQSKAVAEVTNNFYAWELRGRGWHSFNKPVQLEPVYVPFFPTYLKKEEIVDDAKVPNILSRITSLASKAFSSDTFKNESSSFYKEQIAELYEFNAYDLNSDYLLITFTINFPEGCKVPSDTFNQLLIMLSGTEQPVSFEIIGKTNDITVQFVCSEKDSFRVRTQLSAYCPEAIIRESNSPIDNIHEDDSYNDVIDFGIANECTVPIQVYGKSKADSYKSFFGLLDHLRNNEQIILQVLFHGVINPWSKSIMESITDDDGTCFFSDAPEMLPQAKEKVSSPLFAVVIRTAIQTLSVYRLEELSVETINCIANQSRSQGNALMPMSNGVSDELDVSRRISKRLGMLLNTEELANFAHYPDSSIVSLKLNKRESKSKRAPVLLAYNSYVLGLNIHQDISQKVGLSTSERLRHIHIIGATGTGKSTLLTNLIRQDIESDTGFALLDPHGDLVESVLAYIPEHRLKDVVLIDPSDTEYPIGLNLLAAKTEVEKIVLSSDLVASIKRQSTSWGDQMTAILSNAINAFLESDTGGTLFELRRFLVEDSFRKNFLKSVQDPTIIHFWQKEYAMLRKNAISPILIRLDSFLRPKIIRNMMAQKEGLDFNDLIASNKIILVKLPLGLIGEENSHLLGSLIVAKIQQATQARQAINQNERKPFYLYLDEFQNFITPSMSAILSGSRKYGLGLILAHQDMMQVSKYDTELSNSILSNPATRICFRVGDTDARNLERSFSYFEASDLQNLQVGQAIAKVDTASQDFNISTYPIDEIADEIRKNIRETCINQSRTMYGVPRKSIEEQIFAMYKLGIPKEKQASGAIESVAEIKTTQPEKDVLKELPIFNENKSLEEKSQEYLKNIEEIEKITEHRYLQNLIKRMAESKGFKAVIEQSIDNGNGRVDIGLIKDNLNIAVEVSVTNTNGNEVNNILKCFEAGYQPVVMCSNNPKHLTNIKTLATSRFEPLILKNIMFYSPIELFNFLDSLNLSHPTEEKRIKGYRVKVKYTN